jgi:myo-inositol-1(or 4)-monophosphatase
VYPTHRVVPGKRDVTPDLLSAFAAREVQGTPLQVEAELRAVPADTIAFAVWHGADRPALICTLRDRAAISMAMPGVPAAVRKVDAAVLEAAILQPMLGLLDAEAVVVARLEELHSGGVDFRLVSEELGERRFGGESPWVVVVDPIDGSLNAKRCLPFWCISLAFADGPTLDDVRFGYIRDFGTGEEWVAQRGLGATVDGRALGGVRPKERLGVVDLEATNAGLVADAAARLDGHVGRIRVLGALALALCQLADGRVDGVATLKPSRSVDLAAAALIVREAGSMLLTWDTETLDLGLDGRTRAVAARDETWCRRLGELVYG